MIIIIYSLCPIFTNPPDWRKALSNGVKTHLFKLKTSKISQGGALPPPAPPPRSRSGLRPDRRGLSWGEKKWFLREGGGENDWNAQYIPLCDFIDKVVSYALFLSQNPTPGCKWTLVKYEVKPVLLPVDIQRISSWWITEFASRLGRFNRGIAED